jgi:hypothetical protein
VADESLRSQGHANGLRGFLHINEGSAGMLAL